MVIAMAVAVFMALAGPFGTWREPLIERLGFWVIGVGTCGWLACSLELRLRRNERLRKHPAARAFSISALLAPIGALLASAAASLLHHRPIDWSLYVTTVPQVAMVGAGFSALLLLISRRVAAPETRQANADDPTLGGLLPLKLSGAQLLAIQAQDHYVCVHTDQGAVLVSMSFEQALAKVTCLNGARVHRSWWVARAAVVGVQRGDGRAVLALRSGSQAPVSRRYARALRSAGWY